MTARAVWLVVALVAGAAWAGPKKVAPKPVAAKSAYVSLAPVVDRSSTPGVPEAGRQALEAELGRWKVTLAPPGESDAAAKVALGARKVKGLELALSIKAPTGGNVEAALLVSSYPERALASEYRASGSGGSALELVPPLVGQLVSDLAKAEGWAPASRP
ncbi:MAG: hypothetical protein MUC96_00935 [Myxococcaceae bacterium]|nr:hypothetical protein [Myxococcaceae bacterium]